MRGPAIKFGAFAVVALLILLVLRNTMVGSTGGEQTPYRADFSSVAGLRVGDDVRAAGVRVGRVEEIELVDGDTARVRFSLGPQQALTSTTGLVVKYQNLLGQRYLAMTPGREPGTRLPADALVPASRTSPGFDLTALLNGFEPLFETLDPEQVNQLATSIVKTLQGEGGTVASLLDETATLTTSLADKDEVIGQVLDHLTPVLQNLADNDAQFTATVGELRDLMTGLARQRTAIGGSLEGISALSRATADLVEQTAPDVGRTVRALQGTAEIFARNAEVLNAAFAAVPGATGAFARPMSYGTWLNLYLCNAAIEVNGNAIPLGGSADGPYSRICS